MEQKFLTAQHCNMKTFVCRVFLLEAGNLLLSALKMDCFFKQSQIQILLNLTFSIQNQSNKLQLSLKVSLFCYKTVNCLHGDGMNMET